nr:ribonuclease H-like domain-containing protein [Tanacetum cinerariifolium]
MIAITFVGLRELMGYFKGVQVQGLRFRTRLLKIQVAQKKVKIAFENADSSLESVEARLLVYKPNESVFKENIKLLNIEVQLRDSALVTLRQKLEKVEQERDDLKLKLEKFQTSSKNITELLASQTNKKTGLGYNSQVFTRAMFDYDDYLSSESDCKSWPPSSLYDRFQPSDRYHDVPPPYTRTFMPPKPNLVFNTSPTTIETDHSAFTVHLSPTKSEQGLSHTTRPTVPIIEDWVFDSEDESETTPPQIVPSFVQSYDVDHLIKDCGYHAKKIAQPTPRNHAHRVLTQSRPVSITAVRPVSAFVPKLKVTRPRHAKPFVTKSNSPIRRHITRSPSLKVSNSPPKVTAVKAPMVSVAQGNPKGDKISGRGTIKTGKLDFEKVYFLRELKFNLFSVSQMCDKKNSVLFNDTECIVVSPNFKLTDASHVLLKVPIKNNMYSVDLKSIVPKEGLTYLFAKATSDEYKLWHRRIGHLNFKTMNKLVKGNLVRVFSSLSRKENDGLLQDQVFKNKEEVVINVT